MRVLGSPPVAPWKRETTDLRLSRLVIDLGCTQEGMQYAPGDGETKGVGGYGEYGE